MIHLIIRKDGQGVCGLESRGHSGYSEEGSDIVCAAVSTLVITCANALEAVAGVSPVLTDEPDRPRLRVSLPAGLSPEERHDAQIILDTAVLGLRGVAEEYPKYLQIK